MGVNCLFKFRYGYECDESKPCSSRRGQAPIDSIIYATKVYKDDLRVDPEQKLIDNEHLTVHYHNNCVSRYTSSSNTSRYAKDHGVSNTHPAKKKLRRSHTSFDFFTQCLYCGEQCDLSKDFKHPDRWRPAYIYVDQLCQNI